MRRALLLVAFALVAACANASDDQVFYYNTVTGESVWTRPEAMPILDEASGQHYWVVDGKSTWDPPEELAWIRHKVRTVIFKCAKTYHRVR